MNNSSVNDSVNASKLRVYTHLPHKRVSVVVECAKKMFKNESCTLWSILLFELNPHVAYKIFILCFRRCFVGRPWIHDIPHFKMSTFPVGWDGLLPPCWSSGPARRLLFTPRPTHSLWENTQWNPGSRRKCSRKYHNAQDELRSVMVKV